MLCWLPAWVVYVTTTCDVLVRGKAHFEDQKSHGEGAQKMKAWKREEPNKLGYGIGMELQPEDAHQSLSLNQVDDRITG